MKLKSQINNIIKDALLKANITQDVLSVTEATKSEFGDYQFNGAMALSKKLQKNPREIATEIVKNIELGKTILKAEIAGPGFINLHLNPLWIAKECDSLRGDNRLGILKKELPQKVVLDYSGPNMAKQMHVGHIRSTIIGDTIANLLSFLGDEVIRQNHVGDWGTQFGMLIAYLELKDKDGSVSLKDLEQFYKDAKLEFDANKTFANTAREYVVKIQSGDKHCLSLWKKFIEISLGHCEEVYEKLDVNLTRDDVRAESFYNNDLRTIVSELKDVGKIQESNGAQCVFIKDEEIPIIVQKGDGGYLYATTDLAALRYRNQVLNAKRIIYVVDARQAEHFRQVFHVAKDAGFVGDDVQLEHVGFGTMMDKSGKPFKTRDGGTIKLIDLLDEAVLKAKETINNKEDYTSEELDNLAKIIGIGAVKYADLSTSRESNYIFNLDKMLSFEGNTSLYMQYAYARIQSIFRKHNSFIVGGTILNEAIEQRLAVAILRFEDVLTRSAKDAMPHYISAYLYELVTLFMRFYEQCPILKGEVEESTKMSRLHLADLTANTIKQGLDILGIKVINKL